MQINKDKLKRFETEKIKAILPSVLNYTIVNVRLQNLEDF